jgi:HSP90 family molecular chaperone
MEDEFKFKINSNVVKQLGEELVSDETTALTELVKNAFDADASFVNLEINTEDVVKDESLFYSDYSGFIIVEDDGFGMSRKTIIESWLYISYSAKKHMKKLGQKTPSGRTPLGDKGLGRLSTQRLADICEIFTKEEVSKDELHVAFDWRNFNEQTSLSNVPVEVSEKKSNKENGTKLILTNLKNKEVWTGENLENLKGQLTQIISPYKKNRPFEIYLKINGKEYDFDKEKTSFRDIAVANYSFSFDGDKLTVQGRLRPEKLIGSKKDVFDLLVHSDQGHQFGHI